MKTSFKFLFLSSLLAVSLLSTLSTPTATAQTQPTPPPEPPQVTFFQSVTSYFSAFDTNSTTFVSNKFEVWAGAEYVNGLNTASTLGIAYDFNATFQLRSVTKNAGIAGTVLSQELGLGLSKVLYDAKFTVYVDGGYDLDRRRPFAEIGADVRKALTRNTFAGVSLGSKFASGQKSVTPTLGIFAGFVF